MKPITIEWISKAEGDFAISFRYPAESALDAQQRCRVFRNAARKELGLDG